jgi:serine/threonine protein kinase
MGEVFVARQEGVGNFRRTVVLKKLLKDTEGAEDAVDRMLDEARSTGALSHANVVAIIEVGSDGETWVCDFTWP